MRTPSSIGLCPSQFLTLPCLTCHLSLCGMIVYPKNRDYMFSAMLVSICQVHALPSRRQVLASCNLVKQLPHKWSSHSNNCPWWTDVRWHLLQVGNAAGRSICVKWQHQASRSTMRGCRHLCCGSSMQLAILMLMMTIGGFSWCKCEWLVVCVCASWHAVFE